MTWAIKVSLHVLWDYTSLCRAKRFFGSGSGGQCRHSRLEPLRNVAHLSKRHLYNLLTYCKLQVNNAMAEGLNSNIMAIKRRALWLPQQGALQERHLLLLRKTGFIPTLKSEEPKSDFLTLACHCESS